MQKQLVHAPRRRRRHFRPVPKKTGWQSVPLLVRIAIWLFAIKVLAVAIFAIGFILLTASS